MHLSDMRVVFRGLISAMATPLAHIQLTAALLVGVSQVKAVDLACVGLQGNTLSERMGAVGAFERSHT